MNITSLCWLAFNLLSAFVLGFSFIHWWRSGRAFPRFIHRLALSLGVVGALVALTLALTAGLGWAAVAACLLVPPSTAYVGWLWLGGPLLAESGTDRTPRA